MKCNLKIFFLIHTWWLFICFEQDPLILYDLDLLSITENISFKYLSSGWNYKVLSFHFMHGETIIGHTVCETTQNIWNVLQPSYMAVSNEQKWISISKQFWEHAKHF